MDGQSVISATQPCNRNAFKTPNLTKPPKTTATVSAAAVFKRQKVELAQTGSRFRSPQKSAAERWSKRRQVEKVHPLALSFQETSKEYRRHLYSIAVTKINKDVDALLNKLDESNVQTTCSDAASSGSEASPLRLTVAFKYQRLVEKLCSPLSGCHYGLQRTTATGERERVQATLHDRLQAFEKHMEAETHEIKELQRQWEGVVAEMFQLGVTCLGERGMAALLSTAETDTNASWPASKAGSTLFLAEHGSPAQKGRRKRKRVSFVGPDLMSLFPAFLMEATEVPKPSTPAALHLSHEEVQRLEVEMVGLGKQHVADLQRLEKEDQKWWMRKQSQLAHTFTQD
ncbi:uncharacterized protein EKO05_0007346 [Ascochyta rabiei]|uniref:Uncharacterized protein n=1 Tax=Didymella rabiei TaxID=5454 RepID=A0A162WY78_DIDRA|nr:uncharacterized protein EKO05_0007346 [Ascochyta rabiei]KZM19261.1 hypothetical protein ST47_g9624 [Ascochyta rabiei]UPX16967.1 hypothetical protein EKO05_0007346 [Ascochyta rabiei]